MAETTPLRVEVAGLPQMVEIVSNLMAAAEKWEQVADVLATELARWGWGDMHYAVESPQETSVVAALSVYEAAKAMNVGT